MSLRSNPGVHWAQGQDEGVVPLSLGQVQAELCETEGRRRLSRSPPSIGVESSADPAGPAAPHAVKRRVSDLTATLSSLPKRGRQTSPGSGREGGSGMASGGEIHLTRRFLKSVALVQGPSHCE